MKDKIKEIISKYNSYLSEDCIDEIVDLFKQTGLPNLDERREVFRKKVWSWHFKNKKYDKKMIESFVQVWNSLAPDGKYLKHEKEKKFQIAGRLKKFEALQEKYTEQSRINEFKKRLGIVDPNR